MKMHPCTEGVNNDAVIILIHHSKDKQVQMWVILAHTATPDNNAVVKSAT